MKAYLLLILSVLTTCGQVTKESQKLEIPSHKEDKVIVEYSGYTVSYDEANKIPRWVAYELTREETDGSASRDGLRFNPDPALDVQQAEYRDYTHSGWSRGHMAPAADFKWSQEAMAETFYMVNICPQNMEHNRESWNRLENKIRKWAEEYGKIYVVTGPIIGENLNGKIGDSNVTVPDAFFKAVLRTDGDGYKSAAYIMENSEINQPIQDCMVTTNLLEEITGIDLFPALPDDIEETIESQRNYKDWR